MSITVEPGLISYEGVVKSIEKSLIPQVIIVTVENPEIKLTFDMHKMLKVFDLNDMVRVTLSRGRVDFREGVDLVMKGYVISKKEDGEVKKILISLWGFLAVLEFKRNDIFNVFNYMDEVYFKVEVVSK